MCTLTLWHQYVLLLGFLFLFCFFPSTLMHSVRFFDKNSVTLTECVVEQSTASGCMLEIKAESLRVKFPSCNMDINYRLRIAPLVSLLCPAAGAEWKHVVEKTWSITKCSRLPIRASTSHLCRSLHQLKWQKSCWTKRASVRFPLHILSECYIIWLLNDCKSCCLLCWGNTEFWAPMRPAWSHQMVLEWCSFSIVSQCTLCFPSVV